MQDQHLLIFAALATAGLIIIVLGLKFKETTRKVVETLGSVIFHVGVFGILYHKVPLKLWITLVALVISLFILIDPLKIAEHVNRRIYRLFGFLVLFTSAAFALDVGSGFPVWLWAMPLVLYLSPYLIPPLKERMKVILFLSWVLVIGYLSTIGYLIYARFNPEVRIAWIVDLFPPVHLPVEKKDELFKPVLPTQSTKSSEEIQKDTLENQKDDDDDDATKSLTKETEQNIDESKVIGNADDLPESETPPTENTNELSSETDVTLTDPTPEVSGPYLKGLHDADKKFMMLQNKFEMLQKELKSTRDENKKLKKEIEEIKKRSMTSTL